jgi:hypothetical protein
MCGGEPVAGRIRGTVLQRMGPGPRPAVDFLHYVCDFCYIPPPHPAIPGGFLLLLRGQDVCTVQMSDEGPYFCRSSTSENPLVSG